MTTKMFHFKCDDYDVEATVCADSLEAAKDALRATLKPVPEYTNTEHGSEEQLSLWSAVWHNERIHRMLNENGYSVVVYEPGQVLWTEVS